MIPSKLLRGEKVRLTTLNEDDLQQIIRWDEDSDFKRLLDATPAIPRGKAEWKKLLDESAQSDRHYYFAIRLVEDDQLIGYCELEGILWASRVAFVAIGIGNRDYWGKGYGSEALSLLVDFAFREINLHRLQLTVFDYNTRAIAAYEKLGFQREGNFREFGQRDGRRYDMYLYGLLSREWMER